MCWKAKKKSFVIGRIAVVSPATKEWKFHVFKNSLFCVGFLTIVLFGCWKAWTFFMVFGHFVFRQSWILFCWKTACFRLFFFPVYFWKWPFFLMKIFFGTLKKKICRGTGRLALCFSIGKKKHRKHKPKHKKNIEKPFVFQCLNMNFM